MAMEIITIDEIRGILKSVYDPELGVNIIDLGLVYDITNEDGNLSIEMTLTTPGCPMHDTITGGVKAALEGHPAVQSIDVNVVWSPPWSPEIMSDQAKEQLGYF